MSWTDDRVELLKNMWGEGKSASQIAKELGGVTRNAVIGKPVALPIRKPIITAGQPLPPQPSNSEISEEALATVAEVEKKAKKLELMQLFQPMSARRDRRAR